MMNELSLAAMKCRKTLIACMDKGYSRQPWEDYPLFHNPRGEDLTLVAFVEREYKELRQALLAVHVEAQQDSFDGLPDAILQAQIEIADVSNTLDYLFEGLARLRRDVSK